MPARVGDAFLDAVLDTFLDAFREGPDFRDPIGEALRLTGTGFSSPSSIANLRTRYVPVCVQYRRSPREQQRKNRETQ